MNSTLNEGSLALSADGLTLFFLRRREDGRGDVWSSQRDALDQSFRTPVVRNELSGDAGTVGPGYLSADGCRLYLWKSSETATGEDLFVAERDPPPR